MSAHEKACEMKFVPCTMNSKCKQEIRAIDLEEHGRNCPYKNVTCSECEASMMLMERNRHSCIYYLKNELMTVCSSIKHAIEKINRLEVENSALSQKNIENEKNLKELKEREDGLLMKIKGIKEVNNSLSQKIRSE